jgi:hypothetical protein
MGGGNRRIWRKPPTFRKSLTNVVHLPLLDTEEKLQGSNNKTNKINTKLKQKKRTTLYRNIPFAHFRF